jgi:DNA-binding response OmpR family regulator
LQINADRTNLPYANYYLERRMITETSSQTLSPTNNHLLIVEDDLALSSDLALERITELQPNAVILDVMLPGKDGFDICRELRAKGNNVPVLMLTSREDEFDQVLGLELGADDYLVKPAHPRVLLARVKALMRRAQSSVEDVNEVAVLEFGRLKIHGINREVMLGENRIDLTPAEFELLWLLASNAGTVMHRNDILKSLRGLNNSTGDRSVDARLYRLRRRFSEDRDLVWQIKTVRPHGYMFCLEPW